MEKAPAKPELYLRCVVTPKRQRAHMALPDSFYRALHLRVKSQHLSCLEPYHITHYFVLSYHAAQDAPRHFSRFQNYRYIVTVSLFVSLQLYLPIQLPHKPFLNPVAARFFDFPLFKGWLLLSRPPLEHLYYTIFNSPCQGVRQRKCLRKYRRHLYFI